MRTTLATIIMSAAALVAAIPHPRQNCPEATRFGVVTVTPSTFAPGDLITITTDFSCAIKNFGIIPQFADYYIEVPVNNNGHEPPILLNRSTPPNGTAQAFSVVVPMANYFANASYAVRLDTTYPVNGTDGSSYSVVGGVDTPITIKHS